MIRRRSFLGAIAALLMTPLLKKAAPPEKEQSTDQYDHVDTYIGTSRGRYPHQQWHAWDVEEDQ